jgi:3-oxoacyl-[acyl-carrier-protein] synthase III
MRSTTIRSLALALPSARIGNDELIERFGEKSMRSISRMSGIKERRVAPINQCASDLGFDAAQRLIAHLQLAPDDIDVLIFCSQTPDYRMPATASVLQGRLGIGERCCAFDINQACASYIHSLQVAHSMIAAETATRALIISADTLTHIIHPEDRTMVPLTGDAGVATLIEAVAPVAGGFEHFRVCNDGREFDRLYVPAGGARLPSTADTAAPIAGEDGAVRSLDTVYMDGPAVFHFAAYRVSDFLKQCLEDWKLDLDQIDTVLLHQANKTMVDLIYEAVGVSDEKQFTNIENIGNVAAASLPALLADAWREGVVKPGSRTLLCGFGGGLSWGATVIHWPEDSNAAVPGVVDVASPQPNDNE